MNITHRGLVANFFGAHLSLKILEMIFRGKAGRGKGYFRKR